VQRKGKNRIMISEVIIPDLGATGGDVVLVEWLVGPGDAVTAGQPLFIVETDKANVEVEAFRAGVIRELKAAAGAALPPGRVVALLADSMEETVPITSPETSETPQQIDPRSAFARQMATPAESAARERIPVSPLARRIAQEEGLDLASLAGTGSRGQILKRDVLSALKARQSPQAGYSPTAARRLRVSPMRQAIAARTLQSKREAPHFYANMTVDMLATLDTRKQAAAWAQEQGWAPPTISDLCIRATALALRQFPALNASFDGSFISFYSDINIGLVVGLDEGMVIPVVHQADRLDLFALAETTRRVRHQAVAGQLSANQLSGGTFTLSNLGMFGVDSFTAVLNPPEAGILALGAVKEQPAVVGGEVLPRPLMAVTLSVDHRVVDGIVAARFLEAFKVLLENPLRLTFNAPTEAAS
jgi:pyruvate dehydrogenase E2 component (dihydrolipoyllysine-residue acetyltransferase)